MSLQTGILTRVLHDLLPGAKVRHPVHGDGVVREILPHDKRNKPYKIAFSNGETHNYSMQSAAKIVSCKQLKEERLSTIQKAAPEVDGDAP